MHNKYSIIYLRKITKNLIFMINIQLYLNRNEYLFILFSFSMLTHLFLIFSYFLNHVS